ncbi:hypothetical protein CNMCM7691_008635 [Aspergillus felis]|uniref:Ketoreductase (KR) domain-containing protein n=1 Tax=Aspergillus felis TaxID=1287682 RepID=A0A8H6QX45_9EURO|nr:hypothetical protein CNMCM7691_008635 [Aspergillus felis]
MNGVKNLFSIRDPKEHNMRRRLLAPPMSESSLKTVEPVIQALAQLTIHRMREEMDKRGAADIFKWWMFMTMDIIAELSFGTTFGLLKQGEKNQYVMDLEKIPAFGTYRSAFPNLVETARILPLPFFRDIAQAGRRMRGYADECINSYRRLVSGEPSSPKPTLFAKLFEDAGHGVLTHDEIRNEAQGYIIAGSDTTATTLTYLVWSVCQHGEVQQTLVEELAALPDQFGNDDAKRLPYLNQVINETLRLYAATPSGLPRTVPDPGVKLAGHWIPGGVTVTTQAYSLHRDSSVFPQSGRFNPSRWSKSTPKMKDALMAFGGGSRNMTCLIYPLNRIIDLFVPSFMVVTGIVFGVFTFLEVLATERSLAFNFKHWHAQQFTRLWKTFGPLGSNILRPTISPLAAVANGVVLDIGPGDGQYLAHYQSENIIKLYLVEPCVGLHKRLRENVKKAGLEDVTTIIDCGIQNVNVLYDHGITPASVDTIATFSVLCSVPNPEETCRFLYSLLKPGGQWVIVEHVIVDLKFPLARWIQGMFEVVWPTLMGGCNINRDSGSYDTSYESMTRDQYQNTIYAKVEGTWNLHNATQELLEQPLVFFTMLSSTSGVAGRVAGGSARACVPNSVDLGLIEDVGYVADDETGLDAKINRAHWIPINESMLRRIFTYSVLQQDRLSPLNKVSSAQLVTGIAYPYLQDGSDTSLNPRFSHLWSFRGAGRKRGAHGGSGSDDIDQGVRALQSLHKSGADTASLTKACIQVICLQFARILRLSEEVEPGVELRNWVRHKLDVTLSTLDIVNAASLLALAEKIVSKLSS